MLPFSRRERTSARGAPADSVGVVAGLVDDWLEEAGGLAESDARGSGRGDGACPEVTSMKKYSSKQALAARQENEDIVNKMGETPGGASDGQEKDLQTSDLGSVAGKSVKGEFPGCVANEGVSVFDRPEQ